MESKVIDTIIIDGMYMDIQSIEFQIDRKELNETVRKCRGILKDNSFLMSVTISLFNFKPLQAIKYFNSTADDKEKTEETEFRIDTEVLSISEYGIYYRGYSKWTSDFLEVELTNI